MPRYFRKTAKAKAGNLCVYQGFASHVEETVKESHLAKANIFDTPIGLEVPDMAAPAPPEPSFNSSPMQKKANASPSAAGL